MKAINTYSVYLQKKFIVKKNATAKNYVTRPDTVNLYGSILGYFLLYPVEDKPKPVRFLCKCHGTQSTHCAETEQCGQSVKGFRTDSDLSGSCWELVTFTQ